MKARLPDGNGRLEEYNEFINVGLIVTDIDGTLVMGRETIRKQIIRNLRSLRREKTRFTIATGRTYYGVKTLIDELEIERGMPIALYNGGVVLECGTNSVRYQNAISADVVEKIKDFVVSRGGRVLIYTFSNSQEILRSIDEIEIRENVYQYGGKEAGVDVNGLKIISIKNTEEITEQVNAILIEKGELEEKTREQLAGFLQKDNLVSYTDSGNGFVEIKGKGLNKGIIFDILKDMGIGTNEKILAIGDNDNDVELFQYADISVAVANSSQKAIENADYVCDHEGAEGFLDMLQVLIRARKYCREE